MNKKPIFLTLILLLLLSSFAIASQIEAELTVNKGWNLIHGFIHPRYLSGGDIEESNIKVIYTFIPSIQDYAILYPRVDNDKVNLMDGQYLEDLPVWVYSDKEGKIKYEPQEPLPLDYNKLYQGWNFVTFKPEMSRKTFNQIKGDCVIEKVYLWDFLGKRWSDEFSPSRSLDRPIDDDFELYGFVIKVSTACTLGSVGTEVSPPPQLPGGTDVAGGECSDTDQGIDYEIKGEIEGIYKDPLTNVKKSERAIDSCIGEYIDYSDMEYYIARGVITDEQSENRNILFEYYCEDNYLEVTTYECPESCLNGACI